MVALFLNSVVFSRKVGRSIRSNTAYFEISAIDSWLPKKRNFPAEKKQSHIHANHDHVSTTDPKR